MVAVGGEKSEHPHRPEMIDVYVISDFIGNTWAITQYILYRYEISSILAATDFDDLSDYKNLKWYP